MNLAIHEFLPKTNTESTEVLYNFYIVQSEGTEEDTPKLTTVKRTKKVLFFKTFTGEQHTQPIFHKLITCWDSLVQN